MLKRWAFLKNKRNVFIFEIIWQHYFSNRLTWTFNIKLVWNFNHYQKQSRLKIISHSFLSISSFTSMHENHGREKSYKGNEISVWGREKRRRWRSKIFRLIFMAYYNFKKCEGVWLMHFFSIVTTLTWNLMIMENKEKGYCKITGYSAFYMRHKMDNRTILLSTGYFWKYAKTFWCSIRLDAMCSLFLWFIAATICRKIYLVNYAGCYIGSIYNMIFYSGKVKWIK